MRAVLVDLSDSSRLAGTVIGMVMNVGPVQSSDASSNLPEMTPPKVELLKESLYATSSKDHAACSIDNGDAIDYLAPLRRTSMFTVAS